jgi:hypothetical protein
MELSCSFWCATQPHDEATCLLACFACMYMGGDPTFHFGIET